MPTTIKLKNSVTTTSVPSSLVQGEVAINITDKKVWVGNAATTPIQLLGGGADGNFTNISVSSVATFGAGTVSAPSITTTGDTNTGIFFPAADTIAFSEGGVESMRIDSSGNVGIGTSSPARTIDIARSSSSGNSANFPALLVKNTLATQGDGSTTFNYARIDVQAGNGTVFADFGTRYDSYAGAFLGTETNHPIHFQTNGTERMRIDSSGNLLVGDTGSTVTSGKLRVLQTTTDSNYISRIQSSAASGMLGLSIYYSGASPNGTGNVFLVCEDTTTTRMAVRSNGGIANYSANDVNLSDVREKTNIELAGNYLDKICSIPVKTFNYIDQNREDDGGLTLGVIAQEVQAVAPELVMESNWAAKDQPEKMRLSIYQTDLQYALMKAIQELKAELDSVKAELQTLKGN